MSYKSNNFIPTKIDAGLNLYYNASANISGSSGITFASQDTNFGVTFPLTKTSSYFTLPGDAVYMLEASLNLQLTTPWTAPWYSYVFYQWYDLTNNKYVGNKAKINNGLTMGEGRVGDIVCDEIARYATNENINIELRITSHHSDVDAIDGDGDQPDLTGRARCLVYKF
tara:strand:+ start:346 stop:852 length:507 start_codon:yes stop_codon:yes gene_type:complete